MNKVWEWFITKAYAAGETAKDFNAWGNSTNKGPLGSGSFVDTLDSVIVHIAEFAGGLAFLALIVGAWQYLLAGGDETRAEAGKKTITWAIIGIVLVLVFYLIIQAVALGIFQKIPVNS